MCKRALREQHKKPNKTRTFVRLHLRNDFFLERLEAVLELLDELVDALELGLVVFDHRLFDFGMNARNDLFAFVLLAPEALVERLDVVFARLAWWSITS